MQTEEFENLVAHALKKPRPERLYEIDQISTGGPIVGYYWVSVSAAFYDGVHPPGWWYVIQSKDGVVMQMEDDIQLIQETTSK